MSFVICFLMVYFAKTIIQTTIHMKRTLLIILPLGIASMLSAQSISPDVVASAGAHFTGSNAQLNFTIGEPVTTTLSNGSNMLTQGFHQTMLTVTAVNEQTIAEIAVTVFPNPTSDQVNVQLVNNKEDLQLDLFDLNGKLLQTCKINADQSNVQLGMAEYAIAHYVLRIYSSDARVSYSYKIQKMSAN